MFDFEVREVNFLNPLPGGDVARIARADTRASLQQQSTHMVNFDAESYHSATAQTIEEARKLVETGFQYVCDVEGLKLFRKPK